jgi:hypothetical protein
MAKEQAMVTVGIPMSKYTVVYRYTAGKKECPNHEGAFDCTPFCEVCGGEQEY